MYINHTEFEKTYKNLERVYCPYFKDYVYFTDVGFAHLQYKNKYTLRPAKDRDMRSKLLPVAIDIIGLSHTLQNTSQRNRFEKRYINNRKEFAITEVTYYEFLAILTGKRVKIIIKRIGNGEKIFLSVIPFFQQKMPPVKSDIL